MRYLFIVILLAGCSFTGKAEKTDVGWTWTANRPCLVKATAESIEVDGRTEPIIKIDLTASKIGD